MQNGHTVYMPASITHELIATETLNALPTRAQELIFAAPDYYYLGAQGPDLFFFYKPLLSRADNLGKMLHRTKIKEWFASMLDALPHCTGEEFSKCLAYALGYCTHLAADTVFHPFVYNYLKCTDAPRFTHQEIENDWDVHFLKALRGECVQDHRLPFDLRKIAEEGALYHYLAEVAETIGRELSPVPFRRMCRSFSLYLRHSHAAHGKVLHLFGLGSLYPSEAPDPSHLSGKNFLKLSEGRGKNADELFFLATEESAIRISAFLEAFNEDAPLPSHLFSLHLLSGKEIL